VEGELSAEKRPVSTWETAIAELAQLCGQLDDELDARAIAARVGAMRPSAVVAPLADVLVVERAIGRLLSLGWRGSMGGRTVHRLLYDLARWADHDDATAKRLLRHALEFPASPLQRKLTRQRLRRVVQHPRPLWP
jgi:hypothetical protein